MGERSPREEYLKDDKLLKELIHLIDEAKLDKVSKVGSMTKPALDKISMLLEIDGACKALEELKGHLITINKSAKKAEGIV